MSAAYHLGLGRVLTVTREGERLSAQETGRPKFEIVARGVDAFASSHDDLVVFLRDGQAKVTQVLLHEPVYGARLAPRVAAARAKAIEEDFARRIAAAPDRFRDQTPLPGSKEAILRGIDDLQRGAPNYERMSASLAAKIRRQASELQAMFKAFGAVESIFFRGVGPGGYDIYGVKFANGVAEFRILLGADDKADDVIFRPDGNNKPGGIVACSEEGEPQSHGRNRADQGADLQWQRERPSALQAGRGGKTRGLRYDRRGNDVSGHDLCRQSMGDRRSVRGSVWRSCCRDSKRAFTPSRRTAGPAAQCCRAPFRWPAVKRRCADISRPLAAARRTTIA